jgi:hypothetical protein
MIDYILILVIAAGMALSTCYLREELLDATRFKSNA